jgi:hypothetical protein
MIVEVERIGPLQRFRDLAVEPPSTSRREVRIQRLPKQRVGEPITARALSGLLDDRRDLRFVQGRVHPGIIQPARLLEHGRIELAADHCRHRQQTAGCLAKLRESAADDVTYTWWETEA